MGNKHDYSRSLILVTHFFLFYFKIFTIFSEFIESMAYIGKNSSGKLNIQGSIKFKI